MAWAGSDRYSSAQGLRPATAAGEASQFAARARRPAGPWRVSTFVVLLYLAVVVTLVSRSGIGWFVDVGSYFVGQSDRSRVISSLHANGVIGYDGQFSYFIELDPLRARYYIDAPAYRYGRILYPATAWVLAGGQRGALAYAMLVINLLAVAVTVFVLAGYLRRRGLSAWWAAVYGFLPAIALCVFRDLTEPLSLALLACGYVLVERQPSRSLRVAPLFAAAVLARETSALFVVMLAGWLALQSRRSPTPDGGAALRRGLFVAISLGPDLAYRFVLASWLGGWAQQWPSQDRAELVPFAGLYSSPVGSQWLFVLGVVVVPALLWLALALEATLRGGLSLATALLIVNVLLYVVFLPRDVYADFAGAGRASTGVGLAALLSLPTVRERVRRPRWLVPAAVGLLTPMWFLILSFAVNG